MCNHQHSRCHLFNCCTTLYAVFSFNSQRIKISPTSHQRTSITSSKTEQICTELNPPGEGGESRVMEPQYVQCIYYFHPAGLMHELSHYQRDASLRFQWLRPSGIQNIHLCCTYVTALTPYMSRISEPSFLEIISHPDSVAADVLLQKGAIRTSVQERLSARLCLMACPREPRLRRVVLMFHALSGTNLLVMSQPNWITAKVL